MTFTTTAKAMSALVVALLAAACGGSEPDTATEDPARTSTTTPTTTTVADRPTGSFDELVAVTDGKLHIRCNGSGDATVLLIAGWDKGSETWAAVEPTIAERTRVCSYDRFGTGTSDAPTTPQTFETQVADLHELLDEVGEAGPYVVVGHSFGGAEAVTFASTYSDEVAGLMLVDASPKTWPDTVCSVPAYAGGCALMREPVQGERLDAFPAFAAVAAITSLGDLAMTVVTAAHRSPEGLTPEELARLDRLWGEGTDEWAQLSTESRVVTVEDTGHEIQTDQPATVVDEITKLVP
jgi:pimeloyl-ACP methyl ester carboxylesterase